MPRVTHPHLLFMFPPRLPITPPHPLTLPRLLPILLLHHFMNYQILPNGRLLLQLTRPLLLLTLPHHPLIRKTATSGNSEKKKPNKETKTC